MANTKLPKIIRKETLNKENNTAAAVKLFRGTTYDPSRIRHKRVERCDKVKLPKIDDKPYTIPKLEQDVKEENFRCSTALRKRKAQYLTQLDILNEQWQLLEENENALRKNMIIFNKFLRENLVKKERFEENIKHHQNMAKKHVEEIQEMNEELSTMRYVRAMMRSQLEKHSIYYKFLKKVISRTGDFRSVYSLVVRFELLLSTLEETTGKYTQQKNELDMLTLGMRTRNSERVYTLQFMVHKVGVLSQVYNLAKARSKESENMLRNIQLETTRKKANLAITKKLVYELYLAICERQGMGPVFEKAELEEQLTVIYTSLEMLKNIMRKRIKENKVKKVQI